MIWWIDAGAGASGDMLLGALLGLDPDGLPAAQAAVDGVLAELGAAPVPLAVEPVRRNGLAATRALVDAPESAPRTWRDIRPALTDHPAALTVFASLAHAEADVHGCAVDDVHFHEVGALDAIADIVGVTTLWERLAPDHIVVSAVCVGSGSVATAHGQLPVPVPAVTHLLTGVPTFSGAVVGEACTPTGAALLSFLADAWGPQPEMVVHAVGTGAGSRDPDTHPNVVRILSGEPVAGAEGLTLIETTIDDLDPRIYPDVLDRVRTAGALEAWITPVIMKLGRPGVVLTALAPSSAADQVTAALFVHTTTLGVRRSEVDRVALARDFVTVEVAGMRIPVKRGWLDGEVITCQPEFRNAREVAAATGLAVREVLDRARSAARQDSWNKKGSDATDGGDSDVRTPEN
ncbi:MAG: nickel pincer cofactor biosynthesis protein LarC [Actinobacteria bacterium]|nr:nickel pincer cofactor biosynthesis protein LarC [Actinomycetota bacterium]MCB8996948.1 nickel pincer cofactor biosynthesis protein LarC [Actinomycetota bacterium]MCB9414058.1 nickel pincer cofactor biosynthesis protein LarC [Actinomycetota bacterium]HRY08588.1 nickel pincer cofactor biosynthesis protein LarC [Candidatus Nanopelagicales bacterium]